MALQCDPLDSVKSVRYTATIDKRAEVVVYERESGLLTVSVELRGVINPSRTVETLDQHLSGQTIEQAIGLAIGAQAVLLPILSDHNQVRERLSQMFDFRSDRIAHAA